MMYFSGPLCYLLGIHWASSNPVGCRGGISDMGVIFLKRSASVGLGPVLCTVSWGKYSHLICVPLATPLLHLAARAIFVKRKSHYVILFLKSCCGLLLSL